MKCDARPPDENSASSTKAAIDLGKYILSRHTLDRTRVELSNSTRFESSPPQIVQLVPGAAPKRRPLAAGEPAFEAIEQPIQQLHLPRIQRLGRPLLPTTCAAEFRQTVILTPGHSRLASAMPAARTEPRLESSSPFTAWHAALRPSN